jgi:hypothetical protein
MADQPCRIPRQVPPSRHAEWRQLLAVQHGVVAVCQLRAFSVTKHAISANVLAGRWQQVAPRVYATFTGPMPRESRIAAALSYAGPSAIVSHQTAAELWGMRQPAVGPIHVTVPYRCSAVSQSPLVIVHRSRAFRHIAVAGEPPLTSRADTVLDLATDSPTARQAMRTLTELVTIRRVAVSQVRIRLEERTPRRYRKELEEALIRVETGVQSVLEEAYAVEVEIAHGLPRAQRQAPVHVDGQTLYEDAVYDNVGVPLTVRLDGSTHLSAEVAMRDRRRGNTAALAGRTCLVFGWRELSGNPCQASAEVAAVLHRYGWHGPTHRCPACP